MLPPFNCSLISGVALLLILSIRATFVLLSFNIDAIRSRIFPLISNPSSFFARISAALVLSTNLVFSYAVSSCVYPLPASNDNSYIASLISFERKSTFSYSLCPRSKFSLFASLRLCPSIMRYSPFTLAKTVGCSCPTCKKLSASSSMPSNFWCVFSSAAFTSYGLK